MIRLIFLLLCLPFISLGQAHEASALNKSNGWKSLDGTNYSVKYPQKWEVDQSGTMGTTFILFSPLESDKDTFRENVNLVIQNLSGFNIDMKKFVDISEGQLKTMITKSNLIESRGIKSGTEEYHRMVYTGEQGALKLRFEQYYWVINDKAYIITFTCEQAAAGKYTDTGQAILKSFAFKK